MRASLQRRQQQRQRQRPRRRRRCVQASNTHTHTHCSQSAIVRTATNCSSQQQRLFYPLINARTAISMRCDAVACCECVQVIPRRRRQHRCRVRVASSKRAVVTFRLPHYSSAVGARCRILMLAKSAHNSRSAASPAPASPIYMFRLNTATAAVVYSHLMAMFERIFN